MSTTKTMAWAGAALLSIACGGSGEEASGSLAPEGEPVTAPGGPEGPQAPGSKPPGTATPPAAAPCTGKQALMGDLDWTLKVGATTREVHVHVPPTYAPTAPTPVVLSFHGFTSNAREQDVLARMSPKSDAAGFIAVHPEGTGNTQSWNAGACCGDAARAATDDMAFVTAVLDELESKLCVDTHRVYATGMSNGGFLSHRLACEMSTRIAAIAPVAGVLGMPSCMPSRPVSVFQFHGTYDALVPYDGNVRMGFPSVLQTMSQWATRNGCSASPRETSKKDDVTCVTYDTCNAGAEVSLCTVAGGGHTWPGGTPVPALGRTTTNVVATDAMWDFFVRHPMP